MFLNLFQYKSSLDDLDFILFGKNFYKQSSFISLFLNLIFFFIYSYLYDFAYIFILFSLFSYSGYIHYKSNLGLIPNFRFFLIASPGFIQCLFWYFSSDSIRVALLANSFLNSDIFKFIGAISLVAASSSLVGFSIKPIYFKIKNLKFVNIKKYRIIFFVLFSFFAYWFGSSVGVSLLDNSGYATQSNTSTVKFGTLNVFVFYFVSLCYISYMYIKPHKYVFLITSFFVYFFLIFIALRGVRQDPFGIIIALLLINYFSTKINYYRNKHFLIFKLFIVLWFLTVFTGVLRSEFSFDFLLSLFSIGSLFFRINEGFIVFNLDTASMVVGTLNVIPFKILDTGFLLGQSYLDWIPRTLPSFLYSERPLSLAFEMKHEGSWFGWGGIHENAEAYYNFGILGSIFVPMIISFSMNSFGKSFIKSKSLFSAIPIVWLIMLPRYTWYQSFALYKSTLTIFVIIIIVTLLLGILNFKKQ